VFNNVFDTKLPHPLITIASQNSTTVTFTVTNPFEDELMALYYQYPAASTGITQCYQETPLVACHEPIEITAHCMTGPAYSLAVVEIWLVDPESVSPEDDDEVPECCEPVAEDANLPTVLLSFKVYCETHCPSDTVVRDLAVDVDPARSAGEFEAVAKGEGAVFEPSKDHSKEHFCASEDYPCGEDGGLVHVCHYSAKEGYQTYCVPESDSDVVAYFPKDYCGPCVGGYGSSTFRN
jgi:hypothetical protein